MERRYSALGFIAGLYQIAGFLIFVGAVVLGGLALVNNTSSLSPYSGLMAGSVITTILVSSLSGIALIAFGELINLFRDMELSSREQSHFSELNERNTRRTAELLEQLVRLQQQQAQRESPRPPQS